MAQQQQANNPIKPSASSQRLAIVCFSGDFDKALAAFTLATGAAAMNREVVMFFTFWGLNIIKRQPGRTPIGKSILARAFNWLMGGRKHLPLSRLNFFGASPPLMRRMMRAHRVAQLEELIDAAKALGVRFWACEMAMHVLELSREDLIDEIEGVVGVATFLNESKDAQIIFIS